ncbi:hypothetical protein JAAARDRAFT_52806 [Jaapia argillacea MUCL 33604]|uniref:Uncharacterized protein n=1 Tax=Jaapia argillacea MUCL 33604 TaxID=933084 RepID=A0A067QD33_9AGAM|nr:hypothetical protein JAAARDRAFT_52806 [Jaapia argillacea MUCL 33604]
MPLLSPPWKKKKSGPPSTCSADDEMDFDNCIMPSGGPTFLDDYVLEDVFASNAALGRRRSASVPQSSTARSSAVLPSDISYERAQSRGPVDESEKFEQRDIVPSHILTRRRSRSFEKPRVAPRPPANQIRGLASAAASRSAVSLIPPSLGSGPSSYSLSSHDRDDYDFDDESYFMRAMLGDDGSSSELDVDAVTPTFSSSQWSLASSSSPITPTSQPPVSPTKSLPPVPRSATRQPSHWASDPSTPYESSHGPTKLARPADRRPTERGPNPRKHLPWRSFGKEYDDDEDFLDMGDGDSSLLTKMQESRVKRQARLFSKDSPPRLDFVPTTLSPIRPDVHVIGSPESPLFDPTDFILPYLSSRSSESVDVVPAPIPPTDDDHTPNTSTSLFPLSMFPSPPPLSSFPVPPSLPPKIARNTPSPIPPSRPTIPKSLPSTPAKSNTRPSTPSRSNPPPSTPSRPNPPLSRSTMATTTPSRSALPATYPPRPRRPSTAPVRSELPEISMVSRLTTLGFGRPSLERRPSNNNRAHRASTSTASSSGGSDIPRVSNDNRKIPSKALALLGRDPGAPWGIAV